MELVCLRQPSSWTTRKCWKEEREGGREASGEGGWEMRGRKERENTRYEVLGSSVKLS